VTARSGRPRTALSNATIVVVNVAGLRLQHQRLTASGLATPEEVVAWLGAVQAQEYPHAKWGLALRMRRATTDAAIERAFTEGRILRTHVMRPTWHFVTSQDIRWMLALTAPQVSTRMSPYNRNLELDAALFRRSNRAIAKGLRGGAQLTRQELKAVLQRAGVVIGEGIIGVQRLAHLMMQAELDAIVCSGARRARQSTYVLLDDRVPGGGVLPRDEALTELARRYFTSHGPAQLKDFMWWSGLNARDSRQALENARHHLHEDVIEGKSYWQPLSRPPARRSATRAFLLPLYDEYLIAYKDRSDAVDPARRLASSPDPFSAPAVLDGRVVGSWKKTQFDNLVRIALRLDRRLSAADMRAMHEAGEGYAAFIGKKAELLAGSR
jgi:hypothetical protein